MDAGLAQLLRRLQRLALVVLAVGDQEHRLAGLPARSPLQHAARLLQGSRDGRALLRHVAGIDRAQEQLGGAVIGGERALHERLAGEDHQPYAVAAQPIEERRHLQLGALQPRRLHVPSQHAGRGVQGHHQIDAAAPHDLGALPALRPGRRDREQRKAHPEQTASQDALRRSAAGKDLLAPRLGHRGPRAPPPAPDEEGRRAPGGEAQRREPEPDGIDDAELESQERGLERTGDGREVHGAPEKRVARSARPNSPSRAAGQNIRPYSSSY